MKKSHATRFLSLLLSLVLSVALCPPALADWVDFSDVSPSHWAYDSIMYCSEWNIVTGYEDGRFLPENQVTRAQFISMLTRAFYSGEVEAAQQSRPAGTPWYWAHAKVAGDVGMTKNLSAVDDNAMNRYEMAAALDNTAIAHKKSVAPGELLVSIGTLKDGLSMPDSYRDPVGRCYALGVLTGMSDGSFHGEQSMTRAQACVVITRMLDLIQGETPAAPSQPQQPETPEQSGTGLLANGQEATVENVQTILDEIKQEYPAGTPWDDSRTPGNNYYKDGPEAYDRTRDIGAMNANYMVTGTNSAASLQYACGGFMAMVSERIFGKTGAPCRQLTSASQVRPGDILICLDSNGKSTHYAICLGVTQKDNGNWVVSIADGNNGGQVHWDCTKTMAKSRGDDLSTSSYRIYTRYPD